MTIVWSAQARMDLMGIRDFISRDSEHYAQLLIGRIVERVEYVSQMPTLGHPVHEFADCGLWEIHQDGYRIIFGFDQEELQVVTIVHMKQILRRRRLG